MIKWRVYYEDGSTFDNTQGEPEDAPPFKVICIRLRHRDVPGGRGVLKSDPLREVDYYWWRKDHQMWYGGDVISAINVFELYPHHARALKRGVTTLNSIYKEIVEVARKDSDFN